MEDKMYEFLENNPIFCDDIPNELKCLLCLNLMIRPTFLPCGCEYCFKCLKSYLENDKEFCVGSQKLCKRQTVCLRDICENPATNRKIMRLKVKCVFTGCNMESNVDDMVDHVDSCEFGREECPLAKYGCSNGEMSADQMKAHMSNYLIKHVNNMVSVIDDLKSETCLLKEHMIELSNENNELKHTTDEMQKNIANLISEITDLKDEIRQSDNCDQTHIEGKLADFNPIDDKDGVTNHVEEEGEKEGEEEEEEKEEEEAPQQMNNENVQPFNSMSSNNPTFDWYLCDIGAKFQQSRVIWTNQFIILNNTVIRIGLTYSSVVMIYVSPNYFSVKQQVTIAIINQITKQFYTSCLFSIEEYNRNEIMTKRFSKSIHRNGSIIVGERLHLRCTAFN